MLFLSDRYVAFVIENGGIASRACIILHVWLLVDTWENIRVCWVPIFVDTEMIDILKYFEVTDVAFCNCTNLPEIWVPLTQSAIFYVMMSCIASSLFIISIAKPLSLETIVDLLVVFWLKISLDNPSSHGGILLLLRPNLSRLVAMGYWLCCHLGCVVILPYKSMVASW